MRITNNPYLATHWLPRDNDHVKELSSVYNISIDKVYKVFAMEDEEGYIEHWILDDTGTASMVYMVADVGDFIAIQGAVTEQIEVADFLVLSKEEASKRYHFTKVDIEEMNNIQTKTGEKKS